MKRFLLRHNTVTNPAVYRIDIHAHHPWLVVMQPLASECAEILYVIYMRIPVPPRPAGRAKLRSGAGGPSREIFGSQDHRTVSLPSTAAPAPLRRTVIPRSSLRDPLRFKRRRMLRPEGSRATTRGWPRAGAFVADPASACRSGMPGARAYRASHSANQLSLCQTAVWWNSPIDARRRFPMTIAVQRPHRCRPSAALRGSGNTTREIATKKYRGKYE